MIAVQAVPFVNLPITLNTIVITLQRQSQLHAFMVKTYWSKYSLTGFLGPWDHDFVRGIPSPGPILLAVGAAQKVNYCQNHLQLFKQSPDYV